MKTVFLVSSLGDTDLALSTIKSIEKKGRHQCLLISLTKTAQDRVASFKSETLLTKITLPEILGIKDATFPAGSCTEEQLSQIDEYIQQHNAKSIYCGVPSVSSDIPFQIAGFIKDIPVLMAYEFMFKPDPTHALWTHLPALKTNPNIDWALPLQEAKKDFGLGDSMTHIIGHLSIDNAIAAKPVPSNVSDEIKARLQVFAEQSLAFVSSTTQPVAVDAVFLDCLLNELPNYPNMQVRLGLHPGIQDLDAYLTTLLSVYKTHAELCSKQFKIILPDALMARLKAPELSVNNLLYEQLFLKVNVSGSEAASAADRVTQAVPGALINEGVILGKPAYIHSGKPYLPQKYFADNFSTFFAAEKHDARTRQDLGMGLDERTAPERCDGVLTVILP